jgi:DNA-binding winged helix-turn-helix (wHTH) protein
MAGRVGICTTIDGAVVYQFDGFTIDTATRRLLRDGAEVRLAPKSFELLLLLVENRTQAMAKSDLHQRLWPSTYVTETNLAGLIAEIRRALGDSAEDPRYIRTMHRFGYWFIATVAVNGSPPAAAPPAIRYWLVWESRQIPLTDGDNIVGRGPDASVWIDAPGVSRHHALFRLDNDVVTVRDLGSKNGTYVKGKPALEPVRLADGDQIRIGPVVISFRIPPPGASTETAHQ